MKILTIICLLIVAGCKLEQPRPPMSDAEADSIMAASIAAAREGER